MLRRPEAARRGCRAQALQAGAPHRRCGPGTAMTATCARDQSPRLLRDCRPAGADTVLVGPPGCFAARRNTQLSIDVSQVKLDGLLADPELLCDLTIRQALGECGDDVALTIAQSLSEGATLRRPRPHGDEFRAVRGASDDRRQL